MDFKNVVDQIQALEKQIEDNKIDTQFEKNKLYNYLGGLVNVLKRHNAIIAGGMISSLFTNSEINDVDVYFRDKESLAGFIEEIWKSNEWVTSHTKKATLFKYDSEVDVQAIHYDYFDSPEDIFEAFDFTVCMGAFDFKTEEFVFHKDFLKHASQRVLQFNKNTSFPLISLIRSKKYTDEKGYTISKPELFRIVMTCMKLEINSYEELKDHLGGMYGVSYENLFHDVDDDEEFNLDDAIDKIANLNLSEDYFKRPEPVKFDSLDELIHSACGLPMRWFTFDDDEYIVDYNNRIKRLYRKKIDNNIEVDYKDYIGYDKVYKFVKKIDGEYYSFFDTNFKYTIGETIKPSNDYGLHFNPKNQIDESTYYNDEDKVLIEAEVSIDNLKDIDGSLVYTECKVLREVPKDEWKGFITNDRSKLPF